MMSLNAPPARFVSDLWQTLKYNLPKCDDFVGVVVSGQLLHCISSV